MTFTQTTKTLLGTFFLVVLGNAYLAHQNKNKSSDIKPILLPEKMAVVSHILEKQDHLPPQIRLNIEQAIETQAIQYALDPLLITAMIHVESNFRPGVVSWAGAVGLMQVRPIVLRDIEKELNRPGLKSENLPTPEFNIHAGTHYYAKLLRRFHGDLRKALMAYNAGPTLIAKNYPRGVPYLGYQARVLETYLKYRRIQIPL